MKETQKQKILALLQQMSSVGVNSHDLTYIHGIKQAPTRIKELKQQGYNIISSRQLKNKSVTYYLNNLPISNRTTEPKIQPQNIQEQELVPVKKTFMFLGKEITRICWEKPEDVQPSQEGLGL